ncbi:TPA: T9SS type A sorting domain-containing protein [Candidatus Poribacteria bacterium]|nr:T9SS type A sorting domain-containing protein [Candidatus Poribacteria bacterium]
MRKRFYLIIFTLFIAILNLNAQEIKKQPIPIGMFNVYASSDANNLSLATPDLREVWQGVPTDWHGGHYPYEACNLVQHYWPKDISYEPNAATEWWKVFLQEVYQQGNINGEVRLRAIVGDLFPQYSRRGDAWLTRFIQDLCEWEKSGPQAGVIGGWYLVEEPMGSKHNYDPDKFETMIEVINQAESSGGYPRHDRYVDVSFDGAYYTSTKLRRFCRPADVVMISSSSYIWMTRYEQPVYNPKYRDLAWCLNQFRSIVWPDRDLYDLPYPQIHLVLQAYDPIGYRQPTHWEIRQQIREALTPDMQLLGNRTVEPADGIWFFWWPGLTFENREQVDDWLHGRRVAEAIELEIADLNNRSTEVRSGNVPARSGFAFDLSTPFNPDDQIVPYDLAQSGEVQIEIHDTDGVRIDLLNMGIQSPGSLRKFGGPKWQPNWSLDDDTYIFLLYVNEQLMDRKSVQVQRQLSIQSRSHQIGMWSNDNTIEVEWHPASDTKGLRGFSHAWDQTAETFLSDTITLDEFQRSLASVPLEDGSSHYFHLSAVDKNNNLKTPSHLGPFLIDATPPTPPSNLKSSSHQTGIWTALSGVTISWIDSQDETSGLLGYSILWDQQPISTPPEVIDIGSAVTGFVTPQLTDGRWYVHLRSTDAAGNWSLGTAHFGPFMIDTGSPEPPSGLYSTSHKLKRWSSQNRISLSWNAGSDQQSGISTYLILWDQSPDSISNEKSYRHTLTTYTSPVLADGTNHYVHIRSMDKVGLMSAETLHLGPFQIDTAPPSPTRNLAVYYPPDTTKKLDITKWQNGQEFILAWKHETTLEINSYSVRRTYLDKNSTTIKVQGTQLMQSNLDDGTWQFEVRPIDHAGNVGDPSAISIKIDTQISTPQVISNTHTDSEKWYANASPQLIWQVGEDLSGIAKYLGNWDESPDTIPTQPVGDMSNLADGIHFFHFRMVDNASNTSQTAHFKVKIDSAIPSALTVESETHNPSDWSNTKVADLRWKPSQSLSGNHRYSYLIDNTSDTIPDDKPESVESARIQRRLDDGVWYFHIKAISQTGVAGVTTHFRIRIDTKIIKPIVLSPTHPDSEAWYGSPKPQFSWTLNDDLSGISQIYGEWNNLSNTTPDKLIDDHLINKNLATINLSSGVWFFHLMIVDNAGNRSEPVHFKIQMDAAAPKRPILVSGTHPNRKWRATSLVDIRWNIRHNLSGISGYSFMVDQSPNTTPDTKIDSFDAVYQADLADGVWFFHVRCRGNTGVWGDTSHYEVRIDSTPPVVTVVQPTGGNWTSQPVKIFRGQITEEMSGIDDEVFTYRYSNFDWQPFQNEDLKNWYDTDEIPEVNQSNGSEFQIRVRDIAGNVGFSNVVKLFVDTELPSLTLNSPTHPKQDIWVSNTLAIVKWSMDTDFSGISEYYGEWDDQPGTIPTVLMQNGGNLQTTKTLTDGITYFHLTGVDHAGNHSKVVHHRFMIDTQSPTARISIQKAVIVDQKPKRIRFYPADNARVNSGKVQVTLETSERLVELPKLLFDPTGKQLIPLDLAKNGDQWTASFPVTIETGDGIGKFRFSGIDRAGNTGESIVSGREVIIETLIRSDLKIDQDRIVAQDAIVTVPPNAIREDLYLNLEKLKDHNGFRLIAFNKDKIPFQKLTFSKLITLQFPVEPINGEKHIVFYNDNIMRHAIGTSDYGDQVSFRVNQTGEFWIGSAPESDRKISAGWAAPNPFAPANNPTIFHVQTQDTYQSFTIDIFNLTGQKMRTLRNGSNIWDGKDGSNQLVESGLYIYQIRTDDEVINGTVVVIR